MVALTRKIVKAALFLSILVTQAKGVRQWPTGSRPPMWQAIAPRAFVGQTRGETAI